MTVICDLMLIPNFKSKNKKINRNENENKKRNENNLSPPYLTLTLSFRLLQLKANSIDVRIDLLSLIIVGIDLISGLCLT